MRWSRVALLLVVMSSVASPLVPSARAQRRHVMPHDAEADWDHWAGRDTAFLVDRLGAADRVVGETWTFHDVIVGNEHTGPYSIWELTVRVRNGRILRVRARRTGGVGCILEE